MACTNKCPFANVVSVVVAQHKCIALSSTTQVQRLTAIPFLPQTVSGSSASRALLAWVACFSRKSALIVVHSRLIVARLPRSYYEVSNRFACMLQLRTMELCAIVPKSEEKGRDEHASEPQFKDAQLVTRKDNQGDHEHSKIECHKHETNTSYAEANSLVIRSWSLHSLHSVNTQTHGGSGPKLPPLKQTHHPSVPPNILTSILHNPLQTISIARSFRRRTCLLLTSVKHARNISTLQSSHPPSLPPSSSPLFLTQILTTRPPSLTHSHHTPHLTNPHPLSPSTPLHPIPPQPKCAPSSSPP